MCNEWVSNLLDGFSRFFCNFCVTSLKCEPYVPFENCYESVGTCFENCCVVAGNSGGCSGIGICWDCSGCGDCACAC